MSNSKEINYHCELEGKKNTTSNGRSHRVEGKGTTTTTTDEKRRKKHPPKETKYSLRVGRKRERERGRGGRRPRKEQDWDERDE
jgi:hypothetical protein